MTDRDLAALQRESDAFWEAIERSSLSAPVVSCPDWTVGDLAWHLGEVQYFWGTIVEERVSDPEHVPVPDRPADGPELLAWGRDQSAALLRALTETDPATPVWTWAPKQDVAFIRRHQIGEAAVHRWDAQTASGATPGPIEAWVAADAIDEFLEFMAPQVRDGAEALAGSVRLEVTDTDGSWSVGDGDIGVGGHATLRGPASDLLLAMHRRLPLSRLEVTGDQAVAERFIARTDLD